MFIQEGNGHQIPLITNKSKSMSCDTIYSNIVIPESNWFVASESSMLGDVPSMLCKQFTNIIVVREPIQRAISFMSFILKAKHHMVFERHVNVNEFDDKDNGLFQISYFRDSGKKGVCTFFNPMTYDENENGSMTNWQRLTSPENAHKCMWVSFKDSPLKNNKNEWINRRWWGISETKQYQWPLIKGLFKAIFENMHKNFYENRIEFKHPWKGCYQGIGPFHRPDRDRIPVNWFLECLSTKIGDDIRNFGIVMPHRHTPFGWGLIRGFLNNANVRHLGLGGLLNTLNADGHKGVSMKRIYETHRVSSNLIDSRHLKIAMGVLTQFDHVIAFDKYSDDWDFNGMGFLRLKKDMHKLAKRNGRLKMNLNLLKEKPIKQHKGLSTAGLLSYLDGNDLEILKEMNLLDSQLYAYAQMIDQADTLFDQIVNRSI